MAGRQEVAEIFKGPAMLSSANKNTDSGQTGSPIDTTLPVREVSTHYGANRGKRSCYLPGTSCGYAHILVRRSADVSTIGSPYP